MACRLPFLLLGLLLIATQVACGFVPSADFCLPTAGLKELSGCVSMSDKQDACSQKDTTEAKIDCYCTQEMLSTYVDCQSDVTLCMGTHTFDSTFAGLINEWHSHCDSRIKFSATTPPVSTLATTYYTSACQSLYLSCVSGDYETNQCSSSFMPASTTDYLSCVCKPAVYSLFSECMYNGNISCLATSATKSNILGYSICSHFRPGASSLSPADVGSLIGQAQVPLAPHIGSSTLTSEAPLIVTSSTSLSLSSMLSSARLASTGGVGVSVTKGPLPGAASPASPAASPTSSRSAASTQAGSQGVARVVVIGFMGLALALGSV